MTAQELRDHVVTLSEVRAWRPEKIAVLQSRNAETVRQFYLHPLLRAGRIAMNRLENPSDPDQAYRAPATA